MEDRLLEITAMEKNKEKRMKKMRVVWDLWDNIRHTSIHIIGVPEEEEKVLEKTFEEIIAENFPNMEKKNFPNMEKKEVCTSSSPGSADSYTA